MTTLERARNWAGNVAFGAASLAAPTDVDDLCRVVRNAGGARVKALGAGHSFSAIADTDGLLVATDRLTAIGPLDEARRTVTVEGGVRYAELGPWLHERGRALHNLPSLPHVTITGAVATGTHGSGSASGALATAVTAVELVTADGALRRFERGNPDFAGVPVSVGALGIVARLELSVEPTYEIEQRVWTGLPWAVAIEHLDDVLDAATSVSLFTRWQGDAVDQTWTKHRLGSSTGPDLTGLGASAAGAQLHPVGGDGAACTVQLGIPGPWHERLPHFQAGFRPSVGAELQSELFVDRRFAAGAIAALRELGTVLDPVLLASEVRTISGDDLWLSEAFGRDTLAFHFTWRLDLPAVVPIVAELERALAPFEPRPHWGKLTSLPAETIRSRYPRIDQFDSLRRSLDPTGVFDTPALQSVLG